MLKKSIPLVVALAVGGCSAQTFNINGANGEVPTNQTSQHFFVSGIGQEQITDAAAICGGVDKIVKVEAQMTFINGLLAVITFGIYTPRDAKVYCKP
jgi:hypothetical protein